MQLGLRYKTHFLLARPNVARCAPAPARCGRGSHTPRPLGSGPRAAHGRTRIARQTERRVVRGSSSASPRRQPSVRCLDRGRASRKTASLALHVSCDSSRGGEPWIRSRRVASKPCCCEGRSVSPVSGPTSCRAQPL
eukprot:3447020-Prymnesium_polylepis.2